MITAEMVMQVVACRSDRAQRIAAYATHRLAGLLPTDASREIGIGMEVGASYERILPELCKHFGLPTARTAVRRYEIEDPHAAAVSASHQTNHVQRGRIDPDCRLCAPAGEASSGPAAPP